MKAKLYQWMWLGCLLILSASICPAQAFYNPQTGHWLNRDPLQERGGMNLYAVAGCDMVNGVDVLGLTITCKCPLKYFEENGITSEMYDQSGDMFSAKKGAPGPTSGDGEILWNMLQTSRSFNAQDLSVENLKKHVASRRNVVAAISNVEWNFGTDADMKYNHNYWDSMMVVNEGVKPSDAINDLYSGDAGMYQTGCNNTSKLILLKGILDTIGTAQFDVALPVTGGTVSGAAQRAMLLRFDKVSPGGDNPTLRDWIPGDRGYIRGGNKGSNRLAAGEWIIYTGGGRFWGFDGDPEEKLPNLPHQTDLKGMMDAVRGFSGGANETGQRWYPGVGLK